jgi:hypothetical protein
VRAMASTGNADGGVGSLSAPSPSQARRRVCVFDLDDTLIPTSAFDWVETNRKAVEQMMEATNNFASAAAAIREAQDLYDRVVIVTHAEAGWVKLISDQKTEFSKLLQRALDKTSDILRVWTCDNALCRENPFTYKQQIFNMLFHDEKHSITSIGDGDAEFRAARNLEQQVIKFSRCPGMPKKADVVEYELQKLVALFSKIVGEPPLQIINLVDYTGFLSYSDWLSHFPRGWNGTYWLSHFPSAEPTWVPPTSKTKFLTNPKGKVIAYM